MNKHTLVAKKGSFENLSVTLDSAQLYKKASIRRHLLNNIMQGNIDLDRRENLPRLTNIELGTLVFKLVSKRGIGLEVIEGRVGFSLKGLKSPMIRDLPSLRRLGLD